MWLGQAKVCARLLVNCLFKLAQEKSVLRSTDRPAMTIAVDLGRKANKQTNKLSGKYPTNHIKIFPILYIFSQKYGPLENGTIE